MPQHPYTETRGSIRLFRVYNILLTLLLISLVAISYVFIMNDRKLDSCA